jgi:hypothetical protein
VYQLIALVLAGSFVLLCGLMRAAGQGSREEERLDREAARRRSATVAAILMEADLQEEGGSEPNDVSRFG